MQFKHPEILYFLLLLIVPILVHLFQLRRFKKEYFTNVRFLQALSVQTRKSSKIKKWLLLSSRLLLLLFLILAFAQPFFNSFESKNKNRSLFIVLDNSFSMQAKGQKGILLKRAIQDLLEELPENQTFSLLTNDETYWDSDIKTIQSDLQHLDFSASSFSFEAAMSKIKSKKTANQKDILFITDGVGIQKNELVGNENNIQKHLVLVKAEQKQNVAVDSVFIHQTLDNFYEIGVQFKVYNVKNKTFSVALFEGDKLIAKTATAFNLKAKTLFFTIPKKNFQGSATVTDGGLEYDNTLFFSISTPKKAAVLSIGTQDKAAFLSRIYTQAEFDYINYPLQNLDYNVLEKQNTIVLNELDAIPQALQTTLKSFIDKGGNVIFIPSSKIGVSDVNSFLKNVANLQFSSIVESDKLITKINFDHPLFADVFEKKADNFQYPKTKSGFTISGTVASVLSYQDQSPFLSVLEKEMGAFYVFSAPINTENSNFQQSPLIVPTFYKMGISKQNTGVTALTIGKNQSFLVPTTLGKGEILKVSNEAETFNPSQRIFNGKVQLRFEDYPEKAGNYSVFKQKESLESLSFNYARTESDLNLVNSNLFSDFEIQDSIATFFDTLHSQRTDSQVWKWFLALALLFLFCEMLIIRFVK